MCVCLDKHLAQETWLLPLQQRCSFVLQLYVSADGGSTESELSSVSHSREKKQREVMTRISSSELVICVYELVKCDCSLRHKSFSLHLLKVSGLLSIKISLLLRLLCQHASNIM